MSRIYNRFVYSRELLDHFQNPRHGGAIASPDRSVQLENPACGDILELMLRLDGDHIVDIRFRARGCVAAIACGSALTELVQGMNVEQARQVDREELLCKVGGLPPASVHASHLAMEALTALLRGL
jgi:NifU-like protein involved in Fe-S cluster formation